MYNFKLDEDNVWEDGEIYDPKSGNTYNGTMTLVSDNKLDLRGYAGYQYLVEQALGLEN